MFKKSIYIFAFIFLLNSCAGDFESVKRGLTGAKEKSSDEFLVEKKDPLILPPDFDTLPRLEDRSNLVFIAFCKFGFSSSQ